MLDQESGYYMNALDNVDIICCASKIYLPQSLQRHVLYWYSFYLNHPSGSSLAKTTREVCYWKSLVNQVQLFPKRCNNCQQFKNRKTVYRHLPHQNISELKPWDLVHVYMICPYRNSIRQQHPDGAIIWKNSGLNLMTMIDSA